MGTRQFAFAKKLIFGGIGVVFFASVAAFHGAAAIAASSIPLLGALWLLTPAPVVFAWVWWLEGRGMSRRVRLLFTMYLASSVLLAVIVLVVVGWIGSERGIHPAPCQTANKLLAGYPELEQRSEPASFQVPGLGNRVGWFISGQSQSTIMLLHGYGCRRQEMLDHAAALNKAGYSILLFDLQGHGDSDGDAVTLGYYESRDVPAAVEYLKSRNDVNEQNLGLLGISLGAAVAIISAAETPEIKAVVADSPFGSAEKAIEEGFTRVTGLPRIPFSPITLRFIEWRLGVSPEQIVPLDHVAKISPRPLLIIHGTADSEISMSNSESLFVAAHEPKKLILLPGVHHASGMREMPEPYAQLIVGFFDEFLAPDSSAN